MIKKVLDKLCLKNIFFGNFLKFLVDLKNQFLKLLDNKELEGEEFD